MADKRLRKLKRGELLELLLDQEKENERLRKKLETVSPGFDGGSESDFAVYKSGSLVGQDRLEKEMEQERYRNRLKAGVQGAIRALVTVAAVAALAATMVLPVLRIYGDSMAPTLEDGNIVVSLRGAGLKRGDIAAFYYNNKLLVKRVIAGPGDWVDMDEAGQVYVNGEMLEEPYVTDSAPGECGIVLPCQVPDNKFFFMGDHRSVSMDSRNSEMGCVGEEQIVGKLLFCVWPFREIHVVK